MTFDFKGERVEKFTNFQDFEKYKALYKSGEIIDGEYCSHIAYTIDGTGIGGLAVFQKVVLAFYAKEDFRLPDKVDAPQKETRLVPSEPDLNDVEACRCYFEALMQKSVREYLTALTPNEAPVNYLQSVMVDHGAIVGSFTVETRPAGVPGVAHAPSIEELKRREKIYAEAQGVSIIMEAVRKQIQQNLRDSANKARETESARLVHPFGEVSSVPSLDQLRKNIAKMRLGE